MAAQWRTVTTVVEPDNARWYVEARVRGVQVAHRKKECRNFDSKEGALGVFRTIGSVVFDKKTRRWHARPFADCTAAELSTLIAFACRKADRFGTSPGHGLRAKTWYHQDEGFTGNPVVGCWVAYKLSAEDLMKPAAASRDVPDTIESLSHLVEDHYDELLREAGVDQ